MKKTRNSLLSVFGKWNRVNRKFRVLRAVSIHDNFRLRQLTAVDPHNKFSSYHSEKPHVIHVLGYESSIHEARDFNTFSLFHALRTGNRALKDRVEYLIGEQAIARPSCIVARPNPYIQIDYMNCCFRFDYVAWVIGCAFLNCGLNEVLTHSKASVVDVINF